MKVHNAVLSGGPKGPSDSNAELYCEVVMGKVDGDTMQDLINWLYSHEDDIKHSINDFGELHNLFVQLFDREPGAAPPPEEPW